jgi:uncharacterized membrane protein YhiD involved in acid resistance
MLASITLGTQDPVPQPINLPGTENLLSYGTGQIVTNVAMALVFGLSITIVYRHTHKGLSYSQGFTQTILLVAVIVAIVMMVISGSIARAFALVGALSIIRFRTVVKDTRDTAFVFAALALGMAAGTENYKLGAIGCGFLVAIMLLLHATNFGALYKSEFILRFSFDQSKDSAAYLSQIETHARRHHVLNLEPSGDGSSLRLTYDITLDKEKTAEDLTKALGATDGASKVVLIVAKNDIDY